MFVSEALIGEWVAIEEQETGELQMRFYAVPIGIIDTRHKRLRRLGVPARGHTQGRGVSPMYPV